MQIFRNININLYSMYFKKLLNLNNQYEYLRTMYYWNPKAVELFERGTFRMSNFSDKWMRKGISDYFFAAQDEDSILNSPNLFDICYDNLKNTLYLTNTCELSDVLRKIIFEPEKNVFEPFRWDKNCQIHMKQVYESYDSIQVLCTLLIYAQTQAIYTPRGKYRLKNDFSYIKGYKKEVINQNFHLFLDNAVEINMSQISIPSLMESYRDFFKRNNKNSIINALNKNPDLKLNMVMIDPLIPNLDILVRSYMYGDAFSGSTKVIEDSIKFAADLMKQFPEQVTVKTIAVPMTYSFMQIKKKNSESIIKIDIYAPLNNSDDRFSMIIDNIENKEMYDYYAKTFYKMFFDGKPIIPE